MRKRKVAKVDITQCVSCGACVKVCPVNAIYIEKGMYAVVSEKCVGCGRCSVECPASVISMLEI